MHIILPTGVLSSPMTLVSQSPQKKKKIKTLIPPTMSPRVGKQALPISCSRVGMCVCVPLGYRVTVVYAASPKKTPAPRLLASKEE